jgi:hypothetical protein
MKKSIYAYVGALVPALLIGVGLWSPLKQAIAKSPNKAPRFQVDPFWPKPLPSDVETNPAAATDGFRTTGPGATKPWVTGEVAGTAVDSNDHVFTINRGPQGNLVSPETVISHPSPAMIEFDRDGNVVNAWPPNVMSAAAPWWTAPSDPVGYTCAPHDASTQGPCPHPNRGVPTGLHGIYVDYQDNVWIAGNGDGIVQKYSHDGSKLLLQIGQHGICDNPPSNTCGNSGGNALANKSETLLNEPANVKVDPNPDPVTGKRGSVYIADGYGNHRIIVFDAQGKYLRHWGGVVQNAGMPNADPLDRGRFGPGDGGHPHCVALGKDGYLYVCDRQEDRIMVFERAPTNCAKDSNGDNICQPVRIITVVPGTGMSLGRADGKYTNALATAGSAWDLDFSSDKNQTFFFEVDGGNETLWEFDHALAVSDQTDKTGFTTCSTPECGPWPDYILAGFGRSGHMAGDFVFLHSVVLDSKGNLFTGETINGRRIQKFVQQGEVNEHNLQDFRPSGYPDVTLKHYDPRFPNEKEKENEKHDR